MELNEVKEIQKVSYEILLEIDRICKKNDIAYMLVAGTALGAIRHKGFIPWDDDLDIGMTRDDYNRFIEALKKDLSPDYYFHCFETDHKYNVVIPQMKIRKRNTYIKEVNFLLKNKCLGDGLFVDVFVYDHISEKKWMNNLFRCYMYPYAYLLMLLDNLGLNPILLKKGFVNSAIWFSRKNKNSKMWGYSMTWVFSKLSRQHEYKEEDLFPYIKHPFEEGFFPLPHNPDAFLKIEIGEDYMTPPPISKQVPKHTVEYSLTSDHPH